MRTVTLTEEQVAHITDSISKERAYWEKNLRYLDKVIADPTNHPVSPKVSNSRTILRARYAKLVADRQAILDALNKNV